MSTLAITRCQLRRQNAYNYIIAPYLRAALFHLQSNKYAPTVKGPRPRFYGNSLPVVNVQHAQRS